MEARLKIVSKLARCMSEKKPSTEELAQRIDQLLVVLREVSEDLADISKHLKATGAPAPVAAPAPSAPTAPPTPPVLPAARMRSVVDVRMMFPKELENMLTFEDKGGYIEIKPRQYLGSENFAKIASLVRSAGGEYKSAGKESHFRIPK